jgi:serine/threonine-protein kinase
MGSPLYMSPEQLRSSKNVDVRTDVWALGVIVYELLAGQPPFVADTVTGLCAKIAADPATPLRAVNPGISMGLEAVVMRCLEKDMSRRYATVADLALALHPFGSTEGKRAAERIVRIGKPLGSSGAHSAASAEPTASGPHVSTGYAETQANWQTAGAQRRRRNTTLAFVGVGALVVGSLVAVVGYKAAHPKPAPAAAVGADIAPSPTPSVSAPVALAPPPSVDPSASASASATPSASSPPPAVVAPARPTSTGAPARPAPPRPAPQPAQPKPDDLLLDRK